MPMCTNLPHDIMYIPLQNRTLYPNIPPEITDMPLFGCSGPQTITIRSISQQKGSFNMAKGRKIKVGWGGG